MWRPATLILVCAGVAALGVAAAAGGSSRSTRGVTTIDVVEKTTTVGFVDNAPADVDSPGDVVVGASDLFDKRDKQIGTAHWSCVRTNPGLRHCTLTYFLPRGFLTLQGPYRDDGTGTVAITGGTGEYRIARLDGSDEHDDARRRPDLRLRGALLRNPLIQSSRRKPTFSVTW
jgi:hypothetical protein